MTDITDILSKLEAVGRAALYAADESEEREGDDGREHVIHSSAFDELSNALDALEDLTELQDASQHYTGPMRAAHYIRDHIRQQEEELAILRAAAATAPIELLGIPETIKESGGWWQSCSGCHESNEGVPTGPFSKALNCHLGGGCSECGGIGAIWDNGEGYDLLAIEQAKMPTEQQRAADEELRRDAERYRASRRAAAVGEYGFMNAVQDAIFAVMPNTPGDWFPSESEIDAGFDAAIAAEKPRSLGLCPICNGHDADIPCAYTTERPEGCPRTERLKREGE